MLLWRRREEVVDRWVDQFITSHGYNNDDGGDDYDSCVSKSRTKV